MPTPTRFSRLGEFVRHPGRLLHRDREPEACDLCEFSPNVQFSSNHPLEAWIESANKGCVYCQMVVLVTQALKDKHGIDITDGGKGTICLNGGEQSREAARCFITASKDNHTKMILLYNAFDTSLPLKDLPFDCHVSPSADSKACMDLVAQWLNQCNDNHEACNNKPPSSWMPTRLIDVGNGDGDMPKLVLREEVPKGHQFVALSHCWGKTQIIRTLTDNFASHREGIDPSALSKTFLHAIRLTRALKHRYIWIDSLCIIQDDKLDWEREGAKMAQVYGDAALVLAATSAGGGEEGFLVPRKTYFQGQVQVSNPTSKHKTSYTVNYRPLFRHAHRSAANTADGPLGSRAWCFQERALAKRFVSFGIDELTWECRSLNDCECDHVWLRRENAPGKHHPFLVENPDMDWMQLNKLAINAKLENASPRDLYFEWRQNVVHPYSHREITFDSDKLVALSAIASTFHDKLGAEEKYLAGLWRGDLIRGLAWSCVVPRMVTKNYFPSWSWASLNGTAFTSPGASVRGGGVTFTMALKHFNFENTCTVVDAQCVPASTINPHGSVEKGSYITLKGKLTPAVIEFHPRDSEGWKNVGSKAIGASEGSWEYCVKGMAGMVKTRYSLRPDTLLEGGQVTVAGGVDGGGLNETITTATRSSWTQEGVAPPGRTESAEYPAWCFLLGTYKSMETRGSIILVLGRSLADADKFERLGLFEIDLGYKDEATAFGEWEESVVTLV
ncbi:het domain containing protein [Naviculisporaceae sp. PSN 640]